MTQAKQTAVLGVLIVGFVLVLGSLAYVANTMPETPVVPTAAEVAALVVIPAAPIFDTKNVDRICELTDGCEYWEGSMGDLNALNEDEAFDDFNDLLADLVNIDEDYLDFDYDLRDWQVRAYTDDDRDDENWEVKVFVKINYWDTDDEEDDEKVYLLVTSVLDEGDYDKMSIQEVSRTFEF